jgi:hypothetical protein
MERLAVTLPRLSSQQFAEFTEVVLETPTRSDGFEDSSRLGSGVHMARI